MSAETDVRIVVCVDDTDDLTKLTSTGEVSGALAQMLMAGYGAHIEHGITRHQLLLDPAVPYTSHNSSMCFVAVLPGSRSAAEWVDAIVAQGAETLRGMCAESADPGLCVYAIPTDDAVARASRDRLVAFGRSAQTRVLAKEEAYALAGTVPGLSLTEHGGTGQGVIGALAGVGLRLSGDDGRFRGAWDLLPVQAASEGILDIGDVVRWLDGRGRDAALLDADFHTVPQDEPVQVTAHAKVIMHEGRPTILLRRDVEGVWHPLEKADLDRLHIGDGTAAGSGDERSDGAAASVRGGHGRGGGTGGGKGGGAGHGAGSGCDTDAAADATAKAVKKRSIISCPDYVEDADDEEHTSDPTLHLCGSCLYRRLTGGGFSCMRQHR